MGLLDGDIQAIVFGAFEWLLLDGTLISRRIVNNGKGGTVAVDVDTTAIKVLVDPATQAMRQQEGFREDDVALLILAKGIPEPRLDDRIFVRGANYHVLAPIILDAAMATYVLRGRKV